MRFVAVVVMALGCAQGGANGANGQDGKSGQDGATGPAGGTGPEGPAGPPGPAGTPGGGYRWHDVNGAAVTTAFDLRVWDAGGRAWGVDNETGEVSAGALSILYFESGDCSGDAWVAATPRFVLAPTTPEIAAHVAADNVVRPDDTPAEQIYPESVLFSSACSPWPATLARLVPASELVDAGNPPAGFEGPLHPEPVP